MCGQEAFLIASHLFFSPWAFLLVLKLYFKHFWFDDTHNQLCSFYEVSTEAAGSVASDSGLTGFFGT